MSNSNSQEQTIYRYLFAQLQLGFYDNNRRFPTAKRCGAVWRLLLPCSTGSQDLGEGGG